MIERDDKIEGPYSFTEDTKMMGMVTVAAVVEANVRLELFGMVTGDLIVKDQAECIVYGTVDGVVRNRGGTVVVHGTVDDVVDESPSARTTVMPEAYVKGQS